MPPLACGGTRRIVGRSVVGVVTMGAMTLGGLAADAGATTTPGKYVLKASGTSLTIRLAGTTLIGASSSAQATSTQSASGHGAGVVTPAIVGTAKASATATGQSKTVPQLCGAPPSPFPAPLGTLVSLGIACGSAAASVSPTGDLAAATGTGKLVTLKVGFSSADFPTLVKPKSQLEGAVAGLLGTLPTLPTTGLPLGTVLLDLAKAGNANITGLLHLQVGVSTSVVGATATKATARAQTSGAELTILTGLGSGGGPLVTVSLLQGTATSTLDRTTGAVTSTDTPVLASVTINSPIGPPQTITLNVGATDSLLTGTPLATTIAVGTGSATSGPGSGSSTVTPLAVSALKGLSGGVTLKLGAGTETASGAAASGATGTGTGTKTKTHTKAKTHTAPPTTPTTVTSSLAPTKAETSSAAVPAATTVHTGEYWAGGLPQALIVLTFLSGLGILARRRLAEVARNLRATRR